MILIISNNHHHQLPHWFCSCHFLCPFSRDLSRLATAPSGESHRAPSGTCLNSKTWSSVRLSSYHRWGSFQQPKVMWKSLGRKSSHFYGFIWYIYNIIYIYIYCNISETTNQNISELVSIKTVFVLSNWLPGSRSKFRGVRCVKGSLA